MVDCGAALFNTRTPTRGDVGVEIQMRSPLENVGCHHGGLWESKRRPPADDIVLGSTTLDVEVPPRFWSGGRLRRIIFPKVAFRRQPIVRHSGRQVADRHRQVACATLQLPVNSWYFAEANVAGKSRRKGALPI